MHAREKNGDSAAATAGDREARSRESAADCNGDPGDGHCEDDTRQGHGEGDACEGHNHGGCGNGNEDSCEACDRVEFGEDCSASGDESAAVGTSKAASRNAHARP